MFYFTCVIIIMKFVGLKIVIYLKTKSIINSVVYLVLILVIDRINIGDSITC